MRGSPAWQVAVRPAREGLRGGSSCGLDLVAADDGETWSYYPPDGVDSADLNAGSTGNGTGLVVAVFVGASHVTINGLSIHGFQYAGVNSQGGADHLVVENRVFFDGYSQSNASNAGGISCYGCSNAVISHNVIHDIAQLGISMSNVMAAAPRSAPAPGSTPTPRRRVSIRSSRAGRTPWPPRAPCSRRP